MPKRFLNSFASMKVRSRGYLPHWEIPNASYSLTYRLNDSLPAGALELLREERKRREDSSTTARDRLEIRREYERRVDDWLDQGIGACHLRDARVAAMVAESLRHFDSIRYDLFAWCVMPNHVHAVIATLGSWNLPRILHGWKSYTSKQANEILRREGVFWQHESFDRLIRDEADLEQTIRYVLDNPRKAGLNDWIWVGNAGETPA